MNVIRVQDILDSTGATLISGDTRGTVHGVSTDTRSLKPRELFLALSGQQFDGNQFARRASEMGAGALLLAGPSESARAALGDVPRELPVFWHASPRRALADLAAWHRSRLTCPVVGVTGSSGKTTTKSLLGQLLSAHIEVVASPSSFNNEIGVPHTLLLADPQTRVLVIEMGTNHAGEIAGLCRIARPTAGLITNIGASHLEGLGSVDQVAREKSDLFACLPREGFAILNLDCPFAGVLRDAARCRVITVSVEGAGEFDARNVVFHAAGTTFRLRGHEITSPLLGIHNVSNLLMALAACEGLGLGLKDLLGDIAKLSGARGRMERFDVPGLTVFDDSYNANPQSASAAVRVLAGLHPKGRRVLVLGDMLELGASAPELHHKIGFDAAKAGIDVLVLVGELTKAAAAGALEGGMQPGAVLHMERVEDALEAVPLLLGEGDMVLVKASRRMRLERLVRQLIAAREGRQG